MAENSSASRSGQSKKKPEEQPIDMAAILAQVNQVIEEKIEQHIGALGANIANKMDAVETKLSEQLKEQIAATQALLLEQAKQIQTALGTQTQETIKANLDAFVKEFHDQLERRSKEPGANDAAGTNGGQRSGGGVGRLIDSLTPDNLIELIKLWRAPTPEKAIAGQMDFAFRWLQLGSKLGKSGINTEDFTNAAKGIFNPEEATK